MRADIEASACARKLRLRLRLYVARIWRGKVDKRSIPSSVVHELTELQSTHKRQISPPMAHGSWVGFMVLKFKICKFHGISEYKCPQGRIDCVILTKFSESVLSIRWRCSGELWEFNLRGAFSQIFRACSCEITVYVGCEKVLKVQKWRRPPPSTCPVYDFTCRRGSEKLRFFVSFCFLSVKFLNDGVHANDYDIKGVWI